MIPQTLPRFAECGRCPLCSARHASRLICNALIERYTLLRPVGLSRLHATLGARLGHFPFEVDWALPTHGSASPTRIAEAVDVFEDGQFGLTVQWSWPAPDSLCFDFFEEGPNRSFLQF